jgi:AcrR family transcriptional regulator
MAAPTGRYRPLPSGAHKLDRDAVRHDQSERLRRAIVELSAEKGYPAVRIVDLARLSRVSQPTFYSLFKTKEDLLLSAYDDIAGRAVAAVMAAYEAPVPHDERLRGAVAAFVEMGAAEPDEMSLVLLGALGAGETALAQRGRAVGALEQAMQNVRVALADAQEGPRDQGAGANSDDFTMKMLIGGIREVTANRVSRGLADELPGLVDELHAWAGTYPLRLPVAVAGARGRPMRALSGEAAQVAARARPAEAGPLPSGRSALPRSEVLNSQRARIVDATAAIVAEKGLAALTIPEIVRRANVSNETFYSIYPSKHDAFVGAQKVGMRQALSVADAAYRRCLPDWPLAIATGLRALVDYVVSEPAHAHLTIVDTLGASPDTIAIRRETLGAFAAYFAPGYEPRGGVPQAPAIATETVVGGCWQVLHHFVDAGRLNDLPAFTPQLTFLALTPFLGAEAAAEQAVAATKLR